jgi:uncharacterized membrane protein SpoIIM required for sporulation/uncharacterized RDD family membrane protein YckC
MPAAPPPVAPARRSAAARDGAVAIETPELVEVTYTVAGVGSRLLAGLVDLVLAALLVAAVSFLALAAASAMRRFGVALVAGPWFFAVWVLTVFGVAWGYGVLFEVLGDGRTPGKRLLGLRVVMDGGYSVTLGASAVRNLLRVVDAQPIPLYVVGLVGVVASRRGRRLGDVVAGTVVVRERTVRERAAPAAPAPAPPAATSGEQGAPSPRITLLDDERFALLERFVARRAALDPGRAAALEARLVAAVGPALDALAREEEERPPAGAPNAAPGGASALERLLARERAAREAGAAVAGARGAGRGRHALVAEGRERWGGFAARLAEARRRGLAALPEDEVSRFAADYREAAADLARLTTALDGRDDDAAFRLGRLVAEGHNLLYRRARVRPRGALAYVGRTVPGAVLRAWRPVALSALLLFGPMLVSAVAVARAPARAAAVLPESMLRRAAGSAERARRGAGYIEDPELFRPVMAGSIIANNVQVAFVAFAAGVTAGVGTALALVVNGVSIGGVFGLYASYGTFPLILAFVAPHGVLELTAIAVAGGAGLLLAAAVLLPGARTRADALAANAREAVHLVAAATLLLLVAGALEGLVSPIPTWPLAAKLAVSGATAVLLGLWLLGGAGARRVTPPSAP